MEVMIQDSTNFIWQSQFHNNQFVFLTMKDFDELIKSTFNFLYQTLQLVKSFLIGISMLHGLKELTKMTRQPELSGLTSVDKAVWSDRADRSDKHYNKKLTSLSKMTWFICVFY